MAGERSNDVARSKVRVAGLDDPAHCFACHEIARHDGARQVAAADLAAKVRIQRQVDRLAEQLAFFRLRHRCRGRLEVIGDRHTVALSLQQYSGILSHRGSLIRAAIMIY